MRTAPGAAVIALVVVSISIFDPPRAVDGLRMTARRDGAQLVFFAGLEGSGHHFLEELLREESVDYASAPLPPQWNCGSTWNRQHYSDAVGRFRSRGSGTVHVLPQQMSYPMCCLSNKTGRMHTCHPRTDWLAEAAQEAGADLQVILLQRSLADSLAASCLHRHFEPCANQTETLISNAKILAGHMKSLRPEQISCHRYGELESMKTAVQEAFGGTVPQHLVDVVWEDSTSTDSRNQVDGWDDMVSQLQESELMLEQICMRSKQLTLGEVVKRVRSMNMTQRSP